MATIGFHIPVKDMTLEQLLEFLAKQNKELDWAFGGNIDFKNIKVGGIDAQRIRVKELSAISADLGHITAGLIEAVKLISSTIIGSYIATAEGSYPRVELSSVGNLLSAMQSLSNYIQITPNESGSPRMIFSNGSVFGYLYAVGSSLLLNTANLQGDIRVSSGQNVRISANRTNGYRTYVDSWSDLVNSDNNRTLQQDLNTKLNTNGVGGVFYVSSTPGGPADIALQFVNGQLVGYA